MPKFNYDSPSDYRYLPPPPKSEFQRYQDFINTNWQYKYLPFDQRPINAVPPAYRGYLPTGGQHGSPRNGSGY